MIGFPGLGISFNVSDVAFNIFGISIYWYAIFIAIGILIFIIFSKKICIKFDLKYSDIIDLCIIIIPVSILCARLYYIIFELDFYINNPIQILNFRSGGLAIYGGIIGGTICCIIFCKKRNIELLNLTDLIVPFLALGQSIGRWGNFLNKEAYGIETNLPWRMEISENGISKLVHPTFLYESILTFIIFLLLINLINKRKFKGEITFLYIILYSFIRIFIENIRIDSLMFFGVRISQVLSIILFVTFCIIMAKVSRKNKKSENNGKSNRKL